MLFRKECMSSAWQVPSFKLVKTRDHIYNQMT